MVWVLWETNLVLYTQTLEGAPDEWVSGQAVLCGNPDVLLLATVVAGNTSQLEKRQRKQPPALCWWMSPVIATMQPMQLGALAVKSALGLDSSESCHRDLQGRVSKKINGR